MSIQLSHIEYFIDITKISQYFITELVNCTTHFDINKNKM